MVEALAEEREATDTVYSELVAAVRFVVQHPPKTRREFKALAQRLNTVQSRYGVVRGLRDETDKEVQRVIT